MFVYKSKYFFIIESIRDINLKNIKNSKKFNIIYRSRKITENIDKLKEFRKICRVKNINFYVSNNIKLANILRADGVYVSAYNKSLKVAYFKNFRTKIIGSAHNIKEIRLKELQNVDYIFLSPLFPSQKNKRGLGIYRFHNLMKKTKKKIVCLGGLTNKNLKKIKLLKCIGMASISLFHK